MYNIREKLVSIVFMCLLVSASLLGCSSSKVQKVGAEDKPMSMFVEVETTSNWKVLYHRDTKVMYVMSYGSYNIGTFTLLVDANGAPLVYGG